MRRCMAAFSALLLIFGVGVLLTPHLDAANTTVLSAPRNSPSPEEIFILMGQAPGRLWRLRRRHRRLSGSLSLRPRHRRRLSSHPRLGSQPDHHHRPRLRAVLVCFFNCPRTTKIGFSVRLSSPEP